MAMDSSYMNQQQAVPPQPMQVLQPRPGRLPADRPIIKLSVGLIETYKAINKVREDKDTFACLFLILTCAVDSGIARAGSSLWSFESEADLH